MEVKSQVVLRIYDDLMNNKKIYMNEVLAEYKISKRTFYRYISEINIFLCNNFKNQAVYYHRSDNSYRLESPTI